MFTVMTDIGKVTPYHGTIIKKNEANKVLLQTYYTPGDFVFRNPSWSIPSSAMLDERGFLRVWYPDGSDVS